METASSDALALLKQKIESREARVGIIGMGYVGLPLALLLRRGEPTTSSVQ